MKKIKVGLFILSNSWGGAEESVLNLAENIDKDKFIVYLFVNNYLFNRYKKVESIHLVNLGFFESNSKVKKILSLFVIHLKLRKYINKLRINLIHANLENTLFILAINLRKNNIPIIFTLRGDETKIYHNPKTIEQYLLRRSLQKLMRSDFVTITSVSRWLTKDFKKKYKEKIIVIPNGIDTNFFKPIKVSSKKSIILYVGRFVKNKGIEDLIEIAKKLKKYNFQFAGTGPLAKLMVNPNTKNLGFRKKSDLVRLYNEASICIFPSYSEGMSVAALEAMSCGKAVIATNLGFFDFIKNGKDGVLIKVGHKQQIAKAIISLTNSKHLREIIGKNARKKALMYDISQTSKSYESLYKKVIDR